MICNISLFSRIMDSSNPVSLKYIFLSKKLDVRNFLIFSSSRFQTRSKERDIEQADLNRGGFTLGY